MSTDATPSWSGYIFQGEVALCKALEEIIKLTGNNIPDAYCLKLEADEDFSLTVNNILSVFQVKAYLTNDANRISKYKGVIEELINKYYYSIDVFSDPSDGRKKITTYSIKKRDNPIKCNLITDKTIRDYDENLTDFYSRYSSIDLNYFELQHGIYTLENITNKIDEAIKTLCPELNDFDVELKRNYCCNKIFFAIKERHRTKNVKSFSLNEIKGWILNSDLAFNEEIAWFSITKTFFETIRNYIKEYDESQQIELDLKLKLIRYFDEIEKLSSDDIKVLIQNRINAHKSLEKDIKVENIISYFSDNDIREIIIKCFENIDKDPLFGDLTYKHNENNYQLSLVNINIDENSRTPHKKTLYEYCTNIENNNLNKINTIVTHSLNLEKEQVKDVLRNIMQPNFEVETGLDITDKRFEFEFKSVENSIREINNG